MKLFSALFFSAILFGQPPSGGLKIGSTPVSGGTNGDCLTVTTGKLSQQVCGEASPGGATGAVQYKVDSTTFGGNGNIGTSGANVVLGAGTPPALGTSTGNTVVGWTAGCGIDSGGANTYIGNQAGCSAPFATGSSNTFIGTGAGASFPDPITGFHNVAIGQSAMGLDPSSSSDNTVLGYISGLSLSGGIENVLVGALTGNSLTIGNANVFIGYSAGAQETGSNKLYIDNSNTTTPCIGGDFSSRILTPDCILQNKSVTFATLQSTPVDGMQEYCSDCTVVSSSDNTCAASGTGAQAFRVNGAWRCSEISTGPTTNQNIRTLGATFVNGGSALSGTTTTCKESLVAGTIQQVTLIATSSGSATVDVQTVSYTSYTGPGSASSITAAAIPALSSAVKYKDSTLTGWNTTLTTDTVVCFVLSSPSTVTSVEVKLKIAAN